MQAQAQQLESFFQQAVRNSYEGKMGLHDPEVIGYLVRLLCEFADAGNLFQLRDATGGSIEDLDAMILASDPVNGSATSFDAERAMRKYIGDYALFVAGMYPEATDPNHGRRHHRPSISELIRVGKESYFIVSQFNLFEYEREAPFFARMAENFERCVLGLAMVREELGSHSFETQPPEVNEPISRKIA